MQAQKMQAQKNYILGTVRLLVIALWIAVMPIIFIVARLLRIPGYQRIVPFFHAGTCRILGIEVTTSGQMSEMPSTLYVSNHISYVDIFVLGQIPAYFVAKSEVAKWPLFGKLATFQNTLFIERNPKRAREQINVLKAHLQAGASLTLFPEGTSTDGKHVEPFKSSLFAAADIADTRVTIQAVTVAYTHHAGQRIRSQAIRDHYAWYAKMPFLSHFLGLFPLKKVSAHIRFHPVCYIDEFESRKACANHCFDQVNSALLQLVEPNKDIS